MRYRLALIYLLVTTVYSVQSTPNANAQEANVQDMPQRNAPSDATWAIAIHGGAGGSPDRWTSAQRRAREHGIRQALEAGRRSLSGGAAALDVVELVVRMLEDDPTFNAGRGSVMTSDMRAELDAAIMDGRTRACGAVAGVTVVRHPVTLARRVMSETPHVLLVGPGADRFAMQQKVELVDPEFFHRDPNEKDHSLYRTPGGTSLGTVGCVALDIHGNLAAATSTGGMAGKMPGRVGDSPIFGAGTFADNQTCAVSATGVGEEFIRNSIAFDIAAQMRYAGHTLTQAVEQAILTTLPPNTGGVIAVGRDGTIALCHNTPGMTCGAADSGGRFDVALKVGDDHERPVPAAENH